MSICVGVVVGAKIGFPDVSASVSAAVEFIYCDVDLGGASVDPGQTSNVMTVGGRTEKARCTMGC